ncbi:MAG: hypothetical protein JJU23_13965 [Cyclobacteriaceae bacterium]|nr:hypothetical protein [Cyclobacteriaceae bacterium]
MPNSEVVHRYFKKVFDDYTILVQVNPYRFNGKEIVILKDGKIELNQMHFDEEIFDDLAFDEFEETGSLEFQLYSSGLAGEKS